MAKGKKKKEFPERLYVYVADGGGLIASETVLEAYSSSDNNERSSDGILCLAHYELKAVGEVKSQIKERW